MAKRNDNENYEYTVVPVIQTDMSHNDNGFCNDMTCPCHENQENIGTLNNQYQDGLTSTGDTDRLYRGMRGI